MKRLFVVVLALTGLGLPRFALAQQETVVYFHVDVIGSVRMITDQNGQVVERHDYLPFGQPVPDDPPTTERRLFAGKEHDSDTTLDYSVARYYAGLNGRFTTVDPGHVAGDIFNPQTWNGYAYALNNPFRYVDPDGYADGCVGFRCTVTVIGTNPYNPIIWNPSPQAVVEDFPVIQPDPPKPQKRSTADIMRCAAAFSNTHSLAAVFQDATGGAISKDNLVVDAFLGSDASMISNLLTGPNRLETYIDSSISLSIVDTVKLVGNLPDPTKTGLDALGRATIKETASGAAFAERWTDATIATSLFGRTAGKAFFYFTAAKAIWDASTYAVGVSRCR